MNERPEREQQALRDVGRTDVSRIVAVGLVALFLATLASVPLLEPLLSKSSDALEVALDILPGAVRTGRQDGLLAANQALLAGMNHFEKTLEDQSFLRRAIQPPSQRVLTQWLGVGNEQVYLGLDGWLFFRDDYDHVTGPGFLESRVLKRARLESARAADPLPAILELRRDLAARGIELVVMPTPLKPSVHPEFMTRRASPKLFVQNPSFQVFLDKLDDAGVLVFDPAVTFAAAKAQGLGPLYLKTDTHWSPQAVGLAARDLAVMLDSRITWRHQKDEPLVRRSISVSSLGDIARMLEHGTSRDGEPTGNSAVPSSFETTEISRVTTRRGLPWRPDRNAEVLLLGDSFTNIYSDGSLGWGTSAGFAEQLSFELGRPVNRIALNAGGAWSSRQALAREVDSSNRSNGSSGGQLPQTEDGPSASTERPRERLQSTRVVVYQFATRELSQGDWKSISLSRPR